MVAERIELCATVATRRTEAMAVARAVLELAMAMGVAVAVAGQ